MRKIFLYLSIMLFLFPALVFAASQSETQGIIKELQKKYEGIDTITASFMQETSTGSLKDAKKSQGKVYFKKPGKMRWDYEKPNRDVIVSDGRTMWLYQPDLNQAVKRPAEEASSAVALDFLSGAGNLEREFDVALDKKTKDSFSLTLVPKEAQPNVKKLRIEIDRSSLLIKKVITEDFFNNTTAVSLKDIKINQPIKDSLFDFKAPEGAVVY